MGGDITLVKWILPMEGTGNSSTCGRGNGDLHRPGAYFLKLLRVLSKGLFVKGSEPLRKGFRKKVPEHVAVRNEP